MKKIFGLLISLLFLTGCEFNFNSEVFKAETIRTSVYPIEYITDYLYGFDASVMSIYPDGADYTKYDLTDKLIENYSNADLLIYNGQSSENKIAVKFLNNNETIGIIDAMQGMTYKYAVEELWLDPSNFLMTASNIKNGLLNVSPNKTISEKIVENYEELKVEVSKLDVELNTLTSDSNYKTIVASNDLFKYLTKYGVDVIVLNESNQYLTQAYKDVKNMAKKGDIKYLYVIKGEELSSKLSKFIKDNDIKKIEIDPLRIISEESRNNKEDYITIMTETITNYKKELNK